MRDIIKHFEEMDCLRNEGFLLEFWAFDPEQLMVEINRPKGWAWCSLADCSTRKYTQEEINVLHERLKLASDRLQDGLDIIHHDYDDTTNYDNGEPEIGLSPAQRNGRL